MRPTPQESAEDPGGGTPRPGRGRRGAHVSTLQGGRGSVAPARSQLFRLKPVDVIVAQHQEAGGHGLRPSMSLLQLTALSIGATPRTRIFLILGQAVPPARPALALELGPV